MLTSFNSSDSNQTLPYNKNVSNMSINKLINYIEVKKPDQDLLDDKNIVAKMQETLRDSLQGRNHTNLDIESNPSHLTQGMVKNNMTSMQP